MRLIILMIFAITLTSCATEVENNKGEKFPFSMSTSTQDKPSPTVLISHGSICRGKQEPDWALRFRSIGLNPVTNGCIGRKWLLTFKGIGNSYFIVTIKKIS